ncbi:MAG: DUF2169 domain-containing protein [Paracoccus sp. (in: a-proteobacteria)]|uniref:DUF2169 domain-containing protein n=1 Tax=Paracoccus sp. TaxID=267 RepID=UPI0026DFAF0E|nr:DUF2169 domain-containing protein [Paracoccus sp. (in: a-proteobacteria)]MDO5622978.1 DUF2169 domain-containing protein [Paracoccus sp. (in: a-proteobacteria)]
MLNHTPFAASAGFYRDHQDRNFWGLWVKAAFTLRQNAAPLFLPEGAVLHQAPLFSSEHPELLLADADLTSAKERVDLLLTASASQSPEGKFRQISFRLGAWCKRLVLAPPLRWDWRGKAVIDRNERAALLPLDARIAYGGADDVENPLGQRNNPAVLYFADHPGPRRGQAMPPALIGAIPRHWPTRLRLAGTYDETWQTRRAPCLPHDFQPAYWQAAPADQQLERPFRLPSVFDVGGLDDTGPAEGPSCFPLANLDLICAARIGGRWKSADAELQTVSIDMVQRRLNLTYLAAWPVPRAASDVEFDVTKLSLGSSAGFRVRPQDAHLFSATAQEPLS